MSIGVLAAGTMKNYYTTQRYIEEFIKEKLNRKSYYLSELNYKFIIDFQKFLMKHLERFRKMINLAYRLEWIVRDPFEKFQLKFDKVEKEFLSAVELTALEQKIITLPRLSVVRDIFVFCCYTGLAFVDVMNLKPENLVIGIDGDYG